MTSSSSRLGSLDLNLLVVLRALLRERNVTRAAARVGMSQPAASAALARLRRHFDDELLIRRGGGYEVSALARQIGGQVESICADIDRLFATGTEFEPTTSQDEFTILMSDYAIGVFGEQLAATTQALAPRVRLNIVVVRQDFAAGIDRTIQAVDFVVSTATSRFELPEMRSSPLFEDRWVCVVAAGAGFGDALTEECLRDATWVVPYHRESEFPSAVPVSRQLAALGVRPSVAVRVDSYGAVPLLVASTGHVALMQERLARIHADRAGLRILDPPSPLDPFVERLWWHERLTDDPAHRWFRGVVEQATRELR